MRREDYLARSSRGHLRLSDHRDEEESGETNLEQVSSCNVLEAGASSGLRLGS